MLARASAPVGAGYSPIEDYALIGDCHGAALVSRAGSIDWCCLRRFDADPVFCRLLDAERGGFLAVRPSEDWRVERAYLENTNVLRTTFATARGRVAVTDFMPVGRRPGAGAHDYTTLNAPGWLVRLVEGLEGRTSLELTFRPSVAFAGSPARLARAGDRVETEQGACLYTPLELELEGDTASRGFEVGAGERHAFVVAPQPCPEGSPLERARGLLDVTSSFWREWSAYCRYQGRYDSAVRRSALALKLLTYAPTGALVAAPTSSLPETIGGERNWDYRYCWLRDASFTLYALAALGYGGEARAFSRYLETACRRTRPRVKIMYGIEWETELGERVLGHLEGYRGSRPVRTGNGAHDQNQIDTYGEVLDWALLYHQVGGRLDASAKAALEGLVEHVAGHWTEPDQGLWEMRGPARHFVHGKLMCWVAVDRGIRLLGRRKAWETLRRRIADDLLANGIDPSGAHLTGSYDGETGLDASLLLVPLMGFPIERELFGRTVEAVRSGLARGPFVKRYTCPDGVEGEEGAFLICSFWLVDALLWLGREQEARALFEQLLECANDVGLYAEEIEPETRLFLGNFPQAFTHLALVQSAVLLELHRKKGRHALTGAHADRGRRRLHAVLGWRAIIADMIQCKRVGRLLPSRRSVLPQALGGQS